jgi:hypothetical protein
VTCPVAVWSVLTARAAIFLTSRFCIALSAPAPEIFFIRSQPNKRVRAPCRIFFFLPQPRSSARHAEIFFCAAFSVAAQQTFFCCPVASSLRSKPFFWLSGRLRAAVCSHKIIFFGPRSFFFCRPVSSAQNFLTCVTHGISAVHFFRILRQKFEFLASSLCCFWLSDHTSQNQLNWPMGAVEPVLRTSSTSYIYLTLHFSSPTPSTLALVASQHLEPSLSHTSTGSQFQNLFNHGASSQSFRD